MTSSYWQQRRRRKPSPYTTTTPTKNTSIVSDRAVGGEECVARSSGEASHRLTHDQTELDAFARPATAMGIVAIRHISSMRPASLSSRHSNRSTVMFIALLLAILTTEVTQAAITSPKQVVQFLQHFGYAENALNDAVQLAPGALDDSRQSKTINVAARPQTPPRDISSALKLFQKINNLPQTGRADAATLQMMSGKRCGITDQGMVAKVLTEEDGSSANRLPGFLNRGKRYVLHGTKFDRTRITWDIKSNDYTGDLTTSQVDSLLERAFEMWAEHAPLTFVRKRSGTPDIQISFERGNHGDDDAFDGKWGSLAHAFFPFRAGWGRDVASGIAGDVHFDDDELWSETPRTDGVGFLQVAVHEIGHSLGLEHSRERDAIMRPYFPHFINNLKLHTDDIQGIQRLYGSPDGSVTPGDGQPSTTTPTWWNIMPGHTGYTALKRTIWTRFTTPRSYRDDEENRTPGVKTPLPTTPPQPPPNPSTLRPCQANAKLDAIIDHEGDNDVFAVTDNDVYRLRDDMQVAGGWPKSLATVFPDSPPGPVDAAVMYNLPYSSKKYVYLFRGNQYWRYERVSALSSNSKNYANGMATFISMLMSLIDGEEEEKVFDDDHDGFTDGSGGPPWKFQLGANYPKTISTGWRVPMSNVDAVFAWDTGSGSDIYFVKGDQLAKYSSNARSSSNGEVVTARQHPVFGSLFRAIPAGEQIVAATTYRGKLYLFTARNRYWRMTRQPVQISGPKDTGRWWYGCAENRSARPNLN